MATSKQIKNTLNNVKKRVSRLTRELGEAKSKVSKLITDYKRAETSEKKNKAKKSPAKKRPAKKRPAKKKTAKKTRKR